MQGFLKPHLKGERFKGGAIPLEFLTDLSALGEMVIEVAKWCYLEKNPERQRAPKRFSSSISLKLVGVEKSSAIPVIDLETTSPQREDSPQFPGMPTEYESYLIAARDQIVDAIAAAAKDDLLSVALPSKYLSFFDRVGRRLHDGESIEFRGSGVNGNGNVQLTKESRRKLVLASQMKEVTEEVIVRGAISEADQGRMTFELQLPSGQKIDAAIHPQHLDVVLEVFNDYRNGAKALVRGIGRYDRNYRLERIDTIDDIVPLDPLDVPFRLLELKGLRDGWLDGEGTAPNADFLEWLVERFGHPVFDELPLPHVYPTFSGGVRAEWSLHSRECSLSIDPVGRAGNWHALDMNTDKEDEDTYRLADDSEMDRLARQIRSLL